MKVLIADKLHPSAARKLRARSVNVVSAPTLSAADMPEAVARENPDIVVVRSTNVTREAIAASSRLKLIIRAGAGYDNVDVVAASTAGIFVATCPGKNSIAVAELAWGLILASDRRIATQDRDLKDGTWNKSSFGKASGLYGRTLGVVGLGSIGREVALRGRAFGMRVLAWSRNLSSDRARELDIERAETLIDLARAADVISIHVAASSATERLVSAEVIAAMRPDATLINTSRGSVVDEDALLAGIEEKGIRAGLDVYQGEPATGSGAFSSALARSAAVVGTHHVGASTDQAQEAIAAEVARIAVEFAREGTVRGCINLASPSASKTLLTVRHKNRPGVLAKVFDVLSEDQINVEWMDNILYQGAEAACARIQLGSVPGQEALGRIQASTSDVLSVELAAPSIQESP